MGPFLSLFGVGLQGNLLELEGKIQGVICFISFGVGTPFCSFWGLGWKGELIIGWEEGFWGAGGGGEESERTSFKAMVKFSLARNPGSSLGMGPWWGTRNDGVCGKFGESPPSSCRFDPRLIC